MTHGWTALPGCEKSAAMVRRTLGQYVAVCPRLQLTSHTQPTLTLSRIKCERYIFIKKCVRSFIENVIIVDYVSAYTWICIRVYLYLVIYDINRANCISFNIYIYIYIYIYACPQGLSTLAKEFMAATRIMQSSSNELSTLVSGKV